MTDYSHILKSSTEDAAPVDEATKAAIEEGLAQIARGETVTLEQSRINARQNYRQGTETRKDTNAL